MFWQSIRPPAAFVIDLLANNPEGWTFGEYRATHFVAGLQLWIANGVPFIALQPPNPQGYNWHEKFAISKAVAHAQIEKAKHKLREDHHDTD